MTPSKATLPVLIAALLTGAAPALAQEWTFDPNAPLDIIAREQLAANLQTCAATLTGNVQVTQDRVRLLARTMTTQQGKSGSSCGDVIRVDAQGEVFYVTPNERVRADRAVYDLRADTVTFTGGVIVVRGENVSSAQRLVINLRNNNFTFDGDVHAVLYPEQSAQ